MTDHLPLLRDTRWAIFVLAVALTCLLGVAAHWAADAVSGARIDRSNRVVSIDRADRTLSSGEVKWVTLPDTIESASRADDVQATWRLALAPDAVAGGGTALYLSGLRGHARVMLNGQLLLDHIREPTEPLPMLLHRLLLVDLPPYVLRDDGPNILDITLRGKYGVSLSRAIVGDKGALRRARDGKALALFFAPAVVSSLIMCLGLSVLLIWLRRREAIYGYFGAAAVTWGLHTIWTLSPSSITGVHGDVWWTTLYAFVVIQVSLFCLRFSGYAAPRIERRVVWAALAVAPLLYLAAAVGQLDIADTLVRLGMVLLAAAAFGVVARQAWRARSRSNTLLASAGLFAVVSGLRDWVVWELWGRSAADHLPVTLTPYSIVPFVMIVAWYLIDRFVGTQESLEALTSQLESRVASQCAALVSALDHMRSARDGAERANRSKTGFLAAASHDLRQPIHALGLYMGALRQRPLERSAREIVDLMGGSVAALESLLDALLDISRIDAGALMPEPRTFDLGALLRRLTDEFAPEAAERALRLSVRVGGPSPAAVRADPMLVERVLRNLIANAVKYTSSGGVLVTCRPRRVGVPTPQWRVEVWDTGPGIEPAEQERVFDEFYQAGNPQRDRRGGLGLGLSIVRRLASLMKVPLALHSRPGHGTRFALDLPLSREAVEAPVTVEADMPLEGLAVAVIEDDADVRDATRTLLAGWGCRVFDGSDAGEVIRRAQAQGAVPAAIVADLRLHDGRTGLDEIDALRAAFGAVLPALLVSGDSAPERVRLMQESGLPWLAKPLPAARLRSWLAQAETRSGKRVVEPPLEAAS
jgi:signal transduction histidine kinase